MSEIENKPDPLRKIVEPRLAHQAATTTQAFPAGQLLNEFQTQRLELETRNDTLPGRQLELGESGDRHKDFFVHLHDIQTLAQTSLDGFCVARESDARIVEVNHAYCEMLGYSREELLNLRITDVEANETLEETEAHIRKIKVVGRDRFESSHRHKRGHLIHLELSISYSKIDGGIFFAFIRDTTKRKQTEAALNESEERFSLLFDTNLDGILFTAPHGRVVDANPAACAMFQRSGEEIRQIGRNGLVDVSDPRLGSAIEERNRTGQFVGELTFIRKDGTKFSGDISSSTFTDAHGNARTRTTIRDITERKIKDEAFRNSEHLLRLSQEVGGIGSWEADLTNTSQRWSDNCVVLLGFPELSNPTWEDFLKVVHPDDRQRVIDATQSHLDHGTKYDVEYRVIAQNGDIRWMRSSGQAEHDAHGKPIIMRGIVQEITERHLNQLRIEQLLSEQTAILENKLVGIVTVRDRNIIWTNPAFESMLGYDKGELIGTPTRRLYLNDDDYRAVGEDYAKIKLGGMVRKQITFVCKDAQPICLDISGESLNKENSESLWVFVDVTERWLAEQNQKRLARSLKLLSECGTLLIHADNEQVLLNEICQLAVKTGGYLMAWVGFAEHDEAKTVRGIAQSGYEDGYLDSIHVTWSDSEMGQGPAGTSIRTGATVVNQDCLNNPSMVPWRKAAIQRGYRSSIALPLIIKDRVVGVFSTYSTEPLAYSDEEIKLLEELAHNLSYGIETLRTREAHLAVTHKLEFFAHHDGLTGLPNRVLLQDRFDQAVVYAHREQSEIAILFLDLDNFKQVNDGFGHSYGDQLLIMASKRLQSCIRETDTISRHGGDEFVILLTNIKDHNIIEAIAQSILEVFSEPFELGQHTLNISFSIGISVFPNDAKDFEALIKQADIALYQAKDAGRNTFRFFTGEMNVEAMEHMQLQGQLRKAIKNKEFLIHYQPKIDAVSGDIVGAEALVRWRHPEQGLISPAKFIPLAERSGLIIQLGEWILNEACKQATAWTEQHQLPPIGIAVNLSALQFKRGNIIETVTQALEKSKLPAHRLEIELTESILMHDTQVVMKTIQTLKEIGVKFSIDDFGTGYSSLSYLKQLSVDKLKVDQSFVRDMVDDPEDAAIVKAIIQLGHTLRLTTIAEGVETEGQLAMLRDYGCDVIQGYLFSRPLPADEFVVFCKR